MIQLGPFAVHWFVIWSLIKHQFYEILVCKYGNAFRHWKLQKLQVLFIIFYASKNNKSLGFCTHEELLILEKTHDQYSRYWIPIQWCYEHLYEARQYGKIGSDFLLEKITAEIQDFRHGLSKLLKYDWVPIPLIYPQVILLSVRLYFLICLISRQFLKDSEHQLWVPIATIIQFIVYM